MQKVGVGEVDYAKVDVRSLLAALVSKRRLADEVFDQLWDAAVDRWPVRTGLSSMHGGGWRDGMAQSKLEPVLHHLLQLPDFPFHKEMAATCTFGRCMALETATDAWLSLPSTHSPSNEDYARHVASLHARMQCARTLTVRQAGQTCGKQHVASAYSAAMVEQLVVLPHVHTFSIIGGYPFPPVQLPLLHRFVPNVRHVKLTWALPFRHDDTSTQELITHLLPLTQLRTLTLANPTDARWERGFHTSSPDLSSLERVTELRMGSGLDRDAKLPPNLLVLSGGQRPAEVDYAPFRLPLKRCLLDQLTKLQVARLCKLVLRWGYGMPSMDSAQQRMLDVMDESCALMVKYVGGRVSSEGLVACTATTTAHLEIKESSDTEAVYAQLAKAMPRMEVLGVVVDAAYGCRAWDALSQAIAGGVLKPKTVYLCAHGVYTASLPGVIQACMDKGIVAIESVF